MSQEEKPKLGRKPKEAKAKENADKKAEQEAKAKENKAALQDKLAKDLEDRAYVPKKGTGKHFHVFVEVVQHSKSGKKVSNTNVSTQSFETFLSWIKEAARLGYSFGMAHDPFKFYPEKVLDQLKEAVKIYARNINIDNFEYGSTALTKGGGLINGWLNDFYKKRVAHSAKIANEAKKKNDIFD